MRVGTTGAILDHEVNVKIKLHVKESGSKRLKEFRPWPVWLSGWSVGLRYRETRVRFPLRACTSVAVCPRPWLVVRVAATRCVPSHRCFSLSLFLFLPPALSEQKMEKCPRVRIKKKKKKKIERV
uniref:Uncharacterized protein n=1 Tax=Molossus molossus TaxID=27622 RepID=A0A7J8GKE4_MOLMO|nr:hypothetical protein HJG59_011456 [Molossus molossus]